MPSHEKTVIVIPTYNEAGNIKPLIEAIFEHAPQVYVLVVDDSSPDGTAKIVEEIKPRFPNLMLMVRKEKQGLGVAYKAGFRRAMELHPDVQVLGMMDADFYHDPADLPKLLDASKKYELVIGSVYAPGGSPSPSYGFLRYLLSRFGNFYCWTMFGYSLTDWTNAFALIRVSTLKKVNFDAVPAREFAFVFGIKYLILRTGATWKDIGVVAKDRPAGESKVTRRTIFEALLAPIPLVLENRCHISWEVVKFIISGGSAAFTQLALLVFFTEAFHIWYEFSLVLAFCFAFIVSFSLQKFWTFQDKATNQVHTQAVTYFAVLLGNLALNAVLLYLFVEKLHVWYILAQIVIEALLAGLSFLIYKFLIFKKHVHIPHAQA
jgi:dolichol-phosphate mannosyltransferase